MGSGERRTIQVGADAYEERLQFQYVREIYGVPDDFVAGDRLDLGSAARNSGGVNAIIAVSKDGLYLAKTMTDEDWDSLFQNHFLEHYYNYLHDHKDSLLPRFFTAFERGSSPKERWVVMFNWHARPKVGTYTRIYDLKGTTCSMGAGDRLVRIDFDRAKDPTSKIPTLKDLNFVQNDVAIRAARSVRQQMVSQVRTDTAFLQSFKLLDYSLILRVMVVGQCDKEALKAICRLPDSVPKELFKAFFQKQNGYLVTVDEETRLMHVYTLGIIDILAPYTKKKSLMVPIRYHITCGGGNEIADSVSDIDYKARFDKYMHDRIFESGRMLVQDECDAALDSMAASGCHLAHVPVGSEPTLVGDPQPSTTTGRSTTTSTITTTTVSWDNESLAGPSTALPQPLGGRDEPPWPVICSTGFAVLSILVVVASWCALKFRSRAKLAERLLVLGGGYQHSGEAVPASSGVQLTGGSFLARQAALQPPSSRGALPMQPVSADMAGGTPWASTFAHYAPRQEQSMQPSWGVHQGRSFQGARTGPPY